MNTICLRASATLENGYKYDNLYFSMILSALKCRRLIHILPGIAKEIAHLHHACCIAWLDDYRTFCAAAESRLCTSKSQYRKFETNIPRKGIARGQSANFHIHVSVSDLYISRIDLPYSAAGNMWNRSWEYISRAQTHECGNWGLRPRNSQCAASLRKRRPSAAGSPPHPLSWPCCLRFAFPNLKGR